MILEPEQAIVRQLVDRYRADEEYIQDPNSFLAHYLRLYADHMDSSTSQNNIIDISEWVADLGNMCVGVDQQSNQQRIKHWMKGGSKRNQTPGSLISNNGHN